MRKRSLIFVAVASIVVAPSLDAQFSGGGDRLPLQDQRSPNSPFSPSRLRSGFYSGTYSCAQGLTKVTIEVFSGESGTKGRFVFNNGNASGAYTVSISESNGYVVLTPDVWERRPTGYGAVGARMRYDGNRLDGWISARGCGEIHVVRDSMSPSPYQSAAPQTLSQAPITQVNPSVSSAIKSNIAASLDEIVTKDSQNWSYNKYVHGSMRNVSVVSVSQNGRTKTVYADYTYNATKSGWVKVRFTDEQFECLEYWDYQGACRPLRQARSSKAITAALGQLLADTLSTPQVKPRPSGLTFNPADPRECISDRARTVEVCRTTGAKEGMCLKNDIVLETERFVDNICSYSIDITQETPSSWVTNSEKLTVPSGSWVARTGRITSIKKH